MNTKHTPGPWTAYPVSTDTFWRVGSLSGGKPKYAIAEIKPSGRPNEDEANAVLIARAPDLLAEVDRLRVVLNRMGEGMVMPQDGRAFSAAEVIEAYQRLARAALKGE
jgi:hypothetical protein